MSGRAADKQIDERIHESANSESVRWWWWYRRRRPKKTKQEIHPPGPPKVAVDVCYLDEIAVDE